MINPIVFHFAFSLKEHMVGITHKGGTFKEDESILLRNALNWRMNITWNYRFWENFICNESVKWWCWITVTHQTRHSNWVFLKFLTSKYEREYELIIRVWLNSNKMCRVCDLKAGRWRDIAICCVYFRYLLCIFRLTVSTISISASN